MEVRTGADGRLWVRFDYAADLIAGIKQIPGRKWNDRDRCWTIPAHCAALALLVSRFRAEDLFLTQEVEGLLPKTGLEHAAWRSLDRHERVVRDGCDEALRHMHEELTIRGYSRRTRKI